MISFNDILNEIITEIENDIIHSLQQNDRIASGKTIAEFTTTVAGDRAQLIVPKYLDALEYGRSPTRPDAPKSDPTLFEAIQEWCKARGIDEGAAYAITNKIHKKGYEGTPGILTEPLSDDNLGAIMERGMTKVADLMGSDILDLFDVLIDI